MENKYLVSKTLKENQIKIEESKTNGLEVKVLESGELLIKGDASSFVDLSDLLVSLALSEKRDHVHLDTASLINDNSTIQEVILEKE